MLRTTLIAACLVLALATSGEGRVDETKFKSPAARRAADAYHKGMSKLEDRYRKDLDAARSDYVKALNEARNEAIKANNLEEAQQIVALVKAVEDTASAKKAAAVRQRVANSAWVWGDQKDIVVLHADGTVTTSWQKDAQGFWYANPDGTVFWWTPAHPWATIMTFNQNYTSHQSSTPGRKELNRSGKRLK